MAEHLRILTIGQSHCVRLSRQAAQSLRTQGGVCPVWHRRQGVGGSLSFHSTRVDALSLQTLETTSGRWQCGSIAMSSHVTTCPRVIPVLGRFFAVGTAYTWLLRVPLTAAHPADVDHDRGFRPAKQYIAAQWQRQQRYTS